MITRHYYYFRPAFSGLGPGSLWGASLLWFSSFSRIRGGYSYGSRVRWLCPLGCHCYGFTGLSGFRCVQQPWPGGLSVRWSRGSSYMHYQIS